MCDCQEKLQVPQLSDKRVEMGLDKMQRLSEIHKYNPHDVSSHCVCLLSFLPLCVSFSSPQVLLMQESVRRIIEAEESRMGKISNI